MPATAEDVSPPPPDAAVTIAPSPPPAATLSHAPNGSSSPAASPPLSTPPLSPLSLSSLPLLSSPSLSSMLMFPGADPGEYISRRRARQLAHIRLASGWLSFRVLLLCCICLITFGTYWISDTPAALYTQFQRWFGDGFDNSSNANLFAVYSYPNVVLPFVCGLLVDKWLGARWGTMLFVSLSVQWASWCSAWA